MIRDAVAADASAIAAIYADYVRTTAITFEEDAPDEAEMKRRLAATQPSHPWLVATDAAGMIAGYAYARPYHARPAYRWACETSIYLARDRRRRGIGRRLYEALLAELTVRGFVTAIGAITVPNAESTRFHEALAFRAIGVMAGIGFKHGRWHDVGYYQRDLAPRAAPPAAVRGA